MIFFFFKYFLEPGTKANEFYETLKTQYPDNLQVHIAMLASLDPMDVKRFGVLPIIDAENADEEKIKVLQKNHDTIMEITNTVIQSIDSNKLLSQMGMKNDARPDSNKAKLYDFFFLTHSQNYIVNLFSDRVKRSKLH